jgi:hypothetical protein
MNALARTNRSTHWVNPRPDALVYTLKEVRSLGGPSRSQVYKLWHLGKLKLIKVRSRTYVEGDTFRRYMATGDLPE